MLNHISLIKSINRTCKSFFLNSSFNLCLRNSGPNESFYYRIDGTSKAQNHKKNESLEVNVLPWFQDYWIFIEINFISETTFISISIFQGTNENDKKHQLFRIEWDDYNNPEETHAQPHWHITTDKAISENFKEFSGNQFEDSFLTYELVKSEVIDIKNIHFSLNGNWHNNDTHIHKIDNEEKIIKWFQGLFSHLRDELE